jgi:hypothetical protein
MLLVAGGAQNVGKTSFACRAIAYLKAKGFQVYGLKITPHFHQDNLEHRIIQKDSFQIALEKNADTEKDSSRMLTAGADEVFFVQTKSDDALPEVFDFVSRMADKKVLWVCESGGLRDYVDPGLFFYFEREGVVSTKKSALKRRAMADSIIQFDGKDFDFSLEQIQVENHAFKLLK